MSGDVGARMRALRGRLRIRRDEEKAHEEAGHPGWAICPCPAAQSIRALAMAEHLRMVRAGRRPLTDIMRAERTAAQYIARRAERFSPMTPTALRGFAAAVKGRATPRSVEGMAGWIVAHAEEWVS